MKYSIILFISSLSFVASAQQLDTLQTLDSKILASVKEVSPQQVSYMLPSDQVLRKISKAEIVRICYANGTKEENKLSKLPLVTGPEEWEKVVIVDQEEATHGLYKIKNANVSAARINWFRSNRFKLQKRAKQELQMVTAMLGGNVVYLSSQTSGVIGTQTYLYPNNYNGRNYGYYGRTNSYGSVESMNGAVFSSKPLDTLALKKLVETQPTCKLFTELKMRYTNGTIKPSEFREQEFVLTKFSIEKNQIFIDQKLKGVPETHFHVNYFDDKRLLLSYQNASSYYVLGFFIE